MKINIIKSSIKRNPNAGQTTTMLPGKREVSGWYFGEIPEYLKPLIIVNEEKRYSTGEIEIGFLFHGVDVPPQLLKDKNCKLHYQQENVQVNHLPEPDYLYEYENPPVECSECKTKTKLKDIDEDWVNDEYHVYICPHCQSTTGFPEFEFQKITDALNERGAV